MVKQSPGSMISGSSFTTEAVSFGHSGIFKQPATLTDMVYPRLAVELLPNAVPSERG